MQRLKRWWCGLVFATVLGMAGPVQAGIPVLDAGNLVQSILQVINDIEQISNQVTSLTNEVQQITQLGQQLQSMTGARNLGEILNNPALQNYIPTNTIQNYNALVGGYSQLSGLARQMRDQNMIYNCLDRPAAEIASCQAQFAKPYQEKATMQTALESSTQRLQQIQQLMQRINTTTDPKAIGELQARIQAENAMLLHEMSRAQLAMGLYEAEQHAAEMREKERRMEVMSRNGTVVPAAYAPPAAP
jgi:type IV secretion system protein VirB5